MYEAYHLEVKELNAGVVQNLKTPLMSNIYKFNIYDRM